MDRKPSPTTRQHVGLLLVVLAVFGATAGIAYWFATLAPETGKPIAGPFEPSDESAKPDGRPLSAEHSTSSSDKPRAVGRDHAAEPAPECELQITFVDESGRLLSGFQFRWGEVDRGTRSELLRKGDPHDYTPGNSGVADEYGKWLVRTRRLNRIVIQPEAPTYVRLWTRGDALGDLLKVRNMDCIVVPTGDLPREAVQSAWGQAVTVYINCVYEDGQPFDGPVSWVLREMQGEHAVRVVDQGADLSGSGSIVVSGPAGTGLKVSVVSSNRLLFKARASLELLLDPGEHRSTHYLSIPSDPTRTAVTTLEIDCSALPNYANVKIVVQKNPSGLMVDSHEIVGPGVVNTRDLTVGGRFVVVVSGDYTWSSDAIQLERGETKTVVVELTGRGSVSAFVTDKDGNPLQPARIMDGAMAGRGWGRKGPRNGGSYQSDPSTAYADVRGKVVLPGTSAGKRTFCIDALHFKPQLVDATVPVDGEVHLGTIQLELEPSGVAFTIKVSEGDDPTKYYANVYLRGGADLIGNRPYFDEGGRVVFKHLPAGTFGVFVKGPDSAGGWSKTFEIKEGETAEVFMDLTLPKGSQTVPKSKED
ncbi:MAG: hypothetical protein K8I27_10995 [Planctomycetes bacterium]|nr:hypothetical protein [Planctomycetota bacterium]